MHACLPFGKASDCSPYFVRAQAGPRKPAPEFTYYAAGVHVPQVSLNQSPKYRADGPLESTAAGVPRLRADKAKPRADVQIVLEV